MTRGLVFGQGYLGKRISESLNYKLAPKFDVLDTRQLKDFLEKNQPEIVINAVGKTGGPGEVGIDWCELHKEETLRSNVLAALNLGIECSKRRIYFVHLSSGCIYQGNNNGRGFSEEDEPNFFGPQYYAKTKIIAEKTLKELPGKILQLRIRMPIDDRPHPRNLIDKLVTYNRVIDVQNSMTSVPNMLFAMKNLIEKRCCGIYNLTNPGTISPAEIMQMYKDIVEPSHQFEIMKLEELNRITRGKRSNCILNTEKLKKEGIQMPEIQDAVRECLLKYKDALKK